ncbi:hypothetical protein KSP40_PGU005201 [Platanthera guangdongensis]|uniref:Uncharacterized protein n=1 Tax=Platanthera guangdongensis TaxID=2320717 RepID=A0ABR2MYC7_9ASPA
MEIIDPLQKVISASVFKSRKNGKLRKHSIIAHTESLDHMDHLQDLFYDSDSPSTCFQKATKRKRGVVLSSDSDDGHSSDELKPKHISANQAVLSCSELRVEDKSAQSNQYSFERSPPLPLHKVRKYTNPLNLTR